MKTNEERLQGLFAYLNSQTHVQPEEIPNIDLYMDQVTTFMEEHLKNMWIRLWIALITALPLFMISLISVREK